jgi:outer membrane immunogenic protein
MKIILAAATAAATFCAISGVAQAQTAPAGATAPTGVYGTLGYADAHSDGIDLGVLEGRLGYRIMPYAGIEGEAAFGVKNDDVTAAGVTGRAKLDHEVAIYGVGFLPLSDKADLLARVGYGNTKVKVSALGQSASEDGDSWNFGVGGQYHFDGKNGVRLDYTRQEFTKDEAGHADVYSIAYTRRF